MSIPRDIAIVAALAVAIHRGSRHAEHAIARRRQRTAAKRARAEHVDTVRLLTYAFTDARTTRSRLRVRRAQRTTQLEAARAGRQ